MAGRKMKVLGIAATYVGTVVGAGFATGKEIVTFFSQYGLLGTIGIGLSSFFLIWIGTKMMLYAHRVSAYSYKDFHEKLYGKKLAFAFNFLFLLILTGVTAVMLSGAGAIFVEQLGLPAWLGMGICVLVVLIVGISGIRGIVLLNLFTVPFFILFTLVCTLVLFIQHHFTWPEAAHMINGHIDKFSVSAWTAPFAYAAFNLVTAQAVLVPLGSEINDVRLIKQGGRLGGLFLFLLLISGHITLSYFPQVMNDAVPMATIVRHFGPFLFFLFLFVIYGEILNTVTGNVFGIARQLAATLSVPERLLVPLFLLFMLWIARTGYGPLLTWLYPIFGYLGCCLLLILLFKKV